MEWEFWAIQLLIGLGAGVISGALGLGGGILMVPAFMTFVPLMETHTAKGTSLFLIIVISALNAREQNRPLRKAPWRLAAVLAAGSIVGGYSSAWATAMLSEHVILVTFLALLLLLTWRTFLLQPRPVAESEVQERIGISMLIGLAAGIFGGATGTGGGSVLIPLALMAGIVANDRVVGLSNLVMVATAIAGSIAHFRATPEYFPSEWTVGHVYLGLAPLVLLGAVLGSGPGRWLNTRLSLHRRKLLMGIMLLLIGMRLAQRLWVIST